MRTLCVLKFVCSTGSIDTDGKWSGQIKTNAFRGAVKRVKVEPKVKFVCALSGSRLHRIDRDQVDAPNDEKVFPV